MAREMDLPLSPNERLSLRAGDEVLLNGAVLTGRDQACRRLFELIGSAQPLPVPLENELIYFVGPSPARPGGIIGAAGPTTSGRMNPFLPALLQAGLRGCIGKGYLSDEVNSALCEYGAVYFGAVGGTGALLAEFIEKVEVLAFPELLSEAIHRMWLRSFPVVVLTDTHGGNLYDQAIQGSRALPAHEN